MATRDVSSTHPESLLKTGEMELDELLVGVISGANKLARTIGNELARLTEVGGLLLAPGNVGCELFHFEVCGELSLKYASRLREFYLLRESTFAAITYVQENSCFDESRLTEKELAAIKQLYASIEGALFDYLKEMQRQEKDLDDYLRDVVLISENPSETKEAFRGSFRPDSSFEIKPSEPIVTMFDQIMADARIRLDPLDAFASDLESTSDEELTARVFGADGNWITRAAKSVVNFFSSVNKAAAAPPAYGKSSWLQSPMYKKIVDCVFGVALWAVTVMGIVAVSDDSKDSLADDTSLTSDDAKPATPVPMDHSQTPDESINPKTGKAFTNQELEFLSWVDQQITQGKTADQVGEMMANLVASFPVAPTSEVAIGDAAVLERAEAVQSPVVSSRRNGGDSSREAQVSARSQAARRNAAARATTTTVAPNVPVVTAPTTAVPPTTVTVAPTTSTIPTETTTSTVPPETTTTTAAPAATTTIALVPAGLEPIAIQLG